MITAIAPYVLMMCSIQWHSNLRSDLNLACFKHAMACIKEKKISGKKIDEQSTYKILGCL